MKLLFATLALFLALSADAQTGDSTRYKSYKDFEKEDFWDKCYAGGDLMFYGGTGQLYINVSPMFGYRPQNKGFSYGIGATYQFTSFSYSYGGTSFGKYSYSLFGVRGFLRQNLGDHFFVHGEYENYFTKGENVFTQKRESIIIPCANAFVGYKQNIRDYSYYYIMIGYEFIGDRNAAQYVYFSHPLVFKIGYIFDIRGK